MKIVEGVNLHLLKNEKFKTNHITFRFSGEFDRKTVARRVLVAQILATANATYPTAQKFREKLSDLYGASLSTNVSTKGLVHIVDVDIVFVKDRFVMTGEKILEEVIDFLKEILFSPLISIAQYQAKLFDLEQKNLISYLKSDKEDHFYSSQLELKNLFYDNSTLQISRYGQEELVLAENSYTVYQEFQKMLKQDYLDIFILGEFNDYRMLQLLNQFPLESRQKTLNFNYNQPYSNITKEKIEKKDIRQSVLQLGYHLPVTYSNDDYFSLLLFNAVFGAFTHSKLFTELREKEGLAYLIGSQFDIFTGLLNVYAGIDRENRNKVLHLVNKQLHYIKIGRFSSDLINQSKIILKTNRLLLVDYAKSEIEYEYNKNHLEKSYDTITWIDKIDTVSKEDIKKVATTIKLQALYFLEGD